MSKNKEVAVQDDNFPVDMAEFAGAGTEDMTADDMAIPFLKIVQKGSPIMDDHDAGARPGMLMNSVSNMVYDNLILIPCGFKKEVVQWAPRDTGDGIQASHEWDTPLMAETVPDEKGIPTFPEGHEYEGNQLIETRYHYVYVIAPDTGETFPALISMSSTQHTRSRKWAAIINQRMITINGVRQKAPSFAFKYNAKTEPQSKDGNTWYSWVITPGDKVEEEWMLSEAIAFYKSIRADDVKIADEDRD